MERKRIDARATWRKAWYNKQNHFSLGEWSFP